MAETGAQQRALHEQLVLAASLRCRVFPAGVPHGATAGEDAAQHGIDGVLVGGLLELMEGALGEHAAGAGAGAGAGARSEEHTSELQSRFDLVCRLLLEKKKKQVRE